MWTSRPAIGSRSRHRTKSANPSIHGGVDDAEPVALGIGHNDEVGVLRVHVPIHSACTQGDEPVNLCCLVGGISGVEIQMYSGVLLHRTLTHIEGQAGSLAGYRYENHEVGVGDNLTLRTVVQSFRPEVHGPMKIIDAHHGCSDTQHVAQCCIPALLHTGPVIEVRKAVAAVVRDEGGVMELLVFDHPTGETQLPKGTVEVDEEPGAAVLRELHEESGLQVAEFEASIGHWERIAGAGPREDGPLERHIWFIYTVRAPDGLPVAWDHTAEGSPAEEGLVFSFRWVPLDPSLADSLHPLFGPVARMILTHYA